MDRRSFIRTAGIASAGLVGTALAAPALAQNTLSLRMLLPWDVTLPGLGTGAQRLAARIGALSGGRIAVAVEAAPNTAVLFDAVSTGAAELYHATDSFFSTLHNAFNYFTSAPFGLTFAEHTGWIQQGGGQALWDELSGGFGIKPLLAGNTGAQMGMWLKEPIAGLGDLQGLNVRMSGFGADLFRQIGVNVVSMIGAEIPAALQADAIDGAEWFGPWSDLELGIHRGARNYYGPSLTEGGAALTLGVNKAFWDGLSASDQALFAAVAEEENAAMHAEFTYRNALALRTLATEHRVTLRALPDELVTEIGFLSYGAMQFGAIDDIGRRVLAAYVAVRETMRGWTSIAEPGFVAARQRILG